jgi:hypothetical protein
MLRYGGCITPCFWILQIIIGLGKQDFWSGTYERTLLESLSKRWDGLSQTTKKRLETKLLEGKGCENSTKIAEPFDDVHAENSW